MRPKLMPFRMLFLLAFAVAASLLFARDTAEAAGFHVNATHDAVDANPGDFVCETAPGNGVCTLRAAVMEANALPGADVVMLGEGEYEMTLGDYYLDGDEDTGASGDFDLLDDVEIHGAGVETTTILGTFNTSQLDVHEGVAATVTGLTMRGVQTNAPGQGTCGTAIRNLGTLTIEHVSVRNNFGRHVGGICNGGTLTMIDSSSLSNHTGLSGDGAGLRNNGTAELIRVEVSDNAATYHAGGIYNTGTLTITDSLIKANVAQDVFAGGLGGGIFNNGGTLTVTNTTITDNKGDGGGLANTGTATLTNVTVANNRKYPNDKGGIRNDGDLTLTNTIVANNEGGDCSGAVTSGGHNLDSDGTCGLDGEGDLPGVDPRLGDLADNGGPTMTHALLVGSPAIDAGDDAACPSADQRGAPRPADGDGDTNAVCDIGAYEAASDVPGESPTPTPPPLKRGDIDCDGDVDSTDGLAILRYLVGWDGVAGCPPLEDRADLNCDGRIDALDALTLLRHVAGMAVALPPGCGELGLYRSPFASGSPTSGLTVTPSPSPTATPAYSSVSGRIYVDVNGNRTFDEWDLPYVEDLAISGYPHSNYSDHTIPNDDGKFSFDGVPAGEYVIGLDLIIPAICDSLPDLTWTGDPETRATCSSFPNFPDIPLNVSVSVGEDVEDVDLIGEPFRELSGTIWLDGAPVQPERLVALGSGGQECWQGELHNRFSQAAREVTHYEISLAAFADDSCIGGDIQLLVDGSGAGPSLPWVTFWSRQLFHDTAFGVNNRFGEVFDPPITGLAGAIYEAGAIGDIPELPSDRTPVADGTIVSAVINGAVCGQTTTHALYDDSSSLVGNAFGIVVPPAAVSSACGVAGDEITLCVGTTAADVQMTGTWPTPRYIGSTEVPLSQSLVWQPGLLGRFLAVPKEDPCPAPISLPPAGATVEAARVPLSLLLGLIASAIAVAAIVVGSFGVRQPTPAEAEANRRDAGA